MAITGSDPALMYALSGVMRAGASRSGYVGSGVFISLDGQQIGTAPAGEGRVLIDSLRITDALNEQQNRCGLTIRGLEPALESELVITMGSKNSAQRLFAGNVVEATKRFLTGTPADPIWACTALDYTRLLGFTQVTARYTGQPGDVIVKDLVARAASYGFTSGRVVAMPTVDEITFTNETLTDAITRVARRLGAYWSVDYAKVVHFFFEETDNNPRPLTVDHPSLADPTYRKDDSQLATRVWYEGGGVNSLADLAPGSTSIPVETVTWYNAAGGTVVSGPQRIPYTGTAVGGGGGLVGSGIGPASAPTLALQGGGSVNAGKHDYAVTFTTAQGESLASPIASITTGPVTDPTVLPIISFFQTSVANGNYLTIGDVVTFAYAYVTDWKAYPTPPVATLAQQAWQNYTLPSNNDPFNPTMVAGIRFEAPYSTDPRVIGIGLWMYSYNVTHEWRLIQNIENVSTYPPGTKLNYGVMGTGYGAAGVYPLPPSNATGSYTVAVSNIVLGATGVTGRKIYRTAAGQTQLKLLTTLANNTVISYVDSAADAALGANYTGSDTSGLQQQPGQVNAGATTIPVAGTAAFRDVGGWAIIGNGAQRIRYTGKTASALTGIPATGTGALTASVAYNSSITAASMLIGASGIVYPVKQGDPINLLVMAEDVDAQNDLKARVGGTGIVEAYQTDNRVSETEARARAAAILALQATPIETIAYRSRDLKTVAGKTITVDSGMPLPAGSHKIQTVTIDNFRPYANQLPTYTVEASNKRFTLEDLIRRARAAAG